MQQDDYKTTSWNPGEKNNDGNNSPSKRKAVEW